MRIALIIGHPIEEENFCRALAGAYYDSAVAAGHTVEVVDVATLDFDPIRRWAFGKGGDKSLEPALAQARETLLAAEQWVMVFPIWMGGAPALLKGLWERLLIGGYEGHHCHMICTHWWATADYEAMGQHGVKALQDMFALHGITSEIDTFGEVDKVPATVREGWLDWMGVQGRAAA